MMQKIVVGLIVGLIIGVVVGVTILTPKLKTHAASKAVLQERDLEKNPSNELEPVLEALHDGDVIHWRSAPPFPSDRPNVAAQAKDYSKKLSILSGDKMVLPVLAAKDVISPDRLFNAIASGRIDALFATADIAVDKEPALALYSAIPFDPNPQDTLAWMQTGKGHDRLEELFASHNIQPLVCGYLAPEATGWFLNEFKTVEDINGLRIRTQGLAAKVWAKAGATPVELTPENISAAFDQDQLDAASFSTPAIDAKSGFSRFAKNYYFPGWQNQGQPLLLLINNRAWKRLDQERQSLLRISCDQHTTHSHTTAAKAQFEGLSELTKQDVNLRRLPSYILDPLKEAWNQVLAEEARRNKAFREIWEEIKAFQNTRQTWEEMGYLQNRLSD